MGLCSRTGTSYCSGLYLLSYFTFFRCEGIFALEGRTGRCTAIVVSHGATADGSAMTSHANDCENCDFRLSRVPARDWPADSQWPAFIYHSTYPKEVSDRSPTWAPSNLENRVDLIDKWRAMPEDVPLGYIPQVSHTFALFEVLNLK